MRKGRLIRVIVVIVVLVLAAVAGVWFATGRSGDTFELQGGVEGPGGGVRIFADVAYADPMPATSKGHLLDLYVPEDAEDPVPLLIWTHGSAWGEENGRLDTDRVAAAMVDRGYAVAGVAIRSSGVATFPAQAYDIKSAVRYLRANAERYHLDSGRFGIMGESSGGWAALMTGLTSGVSDLEGDVGVTGVSSSVKAVVAFYPPTDFLQMDAQSLDECPAPAGKSSANCHGKPDSPESKLLGCPIESCPELVGKAAPVAYADEDGIPPVLMIHGERDYSVPYGQSRLLFGKLQENCKAATLITVPQGMHGQWQAFLESSDLTAGATTVSTSDCQEGATEPVTPSWDLVDDFLDRAMGS